MFATAPDVGQHRTGDQVGDERIRPAARPESGRRSADSGARHPAQAGTFNFSLDATDPSGLVRTVSFSLKVTGALITSPQVLPVAAIVGVPFTYHFTATGAGPFTWAPAGIPSGFNLLPDGTFTGTTSGTSTLSFNVTVTAGGVTETRRFVLYSRFSNCGSTCRWPAPS
jgi:hypothetical protein